MAFEVQQINPLDLQPSVGVGVNIPFSNTAVFNTTYTTQEAIKANIINYLLTEKAERVFNPDFGAGLRELLFSQMANEVSDTVDYVITTGLATWFPTVNIVELRTQSSPDTNTFTIFLRYRITNTNIQDEILINFEQ